MAPSLIPPFTAAIIEGVADVLGGTTTGLTGSQIAQRLRDVRIRDIDPTNTKRKRLYNALCSRQNQDQAGNCVVAFIREAMDPARYHDDPSKWTDLQNRLNKVLAHATLRLNDRGQVAKLSSPPAVVRNDANARRASVRTGSRHHSAQDEGSPLVFLSHSGEDSSSVRHIAEFIERTFDLPRERILCTSVDGYRIPAGADWQERLRTVIRDGVFTVFWITPAFVNSSFCNTEVGAVWVQENEGTRYPIIYGDIVAAELPDPLRTWQCPIVSENTLRDLACSESGIVSGFRSLITQHRGGSMAL